MKSKSPTFDSSWERNIYSKGRSLNLYPYSSLVSFIFKNFGKVKNRSKVKILELGCGAGNNLWFLAREGFSVWGIDASLTATKFAKKRFSAEGLKGEIILGDITNLPYPDDFFDLCIDRATLSCLTKESIARAISEISRVLKRGGILYSEMFSDLHGHKRYGRKISENLWGDFSGGSFEVMGQVYIATEQNVLVFFNNFLIVSLSLGTNRDLQTGKMEESSFRIVAKKL